MKAEHRNPFDVLSEVELNVGTKTDLFEETEVFGDLRFDDDELDIDGMYSINVSVTRAHLELELWGSEIIPGSRLNDQNAPTIERETVERRRKIARSAVEGGLGADAKDLSFGSTGRARIELAQEAEHSETSTKRFSDPAVKCRSGKRWLIQESGTQQPLSGTYISNERICAIQAHENANTVEVLARITARRRDFTVEPEGNQIEVRWRKLKHQQKFITAILTKALVEADLQGESELIAGRIVLGQSKLYLDDDET